MLSVSDSSPGVFRVCATTGSLRAECVVSSSHSNEAVFGSSTYALIVSSDSADKGHSEGDIREIPVHVIFDSSVAVGEVKISRTVQLSLYGSMLISTTIIGRPISLQPISRPPVAARVYVGLWLVQNAEQALLMEVSRQCMQDIAAMGIRYQAFNKHARFALTGWMTASVAVHVASNSELSDLSSSPFLVGNDTVVEFGQSSEPVWTGNGATRQHFVEAVSAQFVGSVKQIGLIADMLCPSQDYDSSESTLESECPARRGMLVTGGPGSGKTHLCTVLREVLQSVYTGRVEGDRVRVFDLRRLDEMERGDGEALLLSLPTRLSPSTRLLVLENIDVCCLREDGGSVSSVTQLTQTAALRAMVDTVMSMYPLCRVLATSSATALDPGVLLQHRLGGYKVTIQSLDTAERATLLSRLLEGFELVIDCETPHAEDGASVREAGLRDIASRCQGLSASDVIGFVKRAINVHSHSVLLSKLQQEAMCAAPSELQQQSSSSALKLLKDVSQAPELPGYESIVKNLLQSTVEFYDRTNNTRLVYEKLGIRPSSGILIQGASGTGKTALAHLLGKKASTHFKFLSVSCAELVHKVVGETERKLSDIFSAARLMAPCFLLLDNLDIILGRSDSDDNDDNDDDDISDDSPGNNSSRSVTGGVGRGSRRASSVAFDRMLSTLLVEIDGIGDAAPAVDKYSTADSGGQLMKTVRATTARLSSALPTKAPVVVIATTSDTAILDRALTRPGRLETHIKLKLPSDVERYEILESLLKGKIHPDESVQDLLEDLTLATEEKPPSFLRELVLGGCMSAMRDALSTVDAKVGPAAVSVSRRHFSDILQEDCEP